MIVFIAGIHGVGKGSVCGRLEKALDFKHHSASALMKWEKMSAKDNKLVKDIPSTQDLLLKALKKAKQDAPRIILDGHFVLLNENSSPTPIDIDVFEGIAPDLIICLTHPVETIRDRLLGRDGKAFTTDLLAEMQYLESNISERYAEQLNIPYLVCDSSQFELVKSKILSNESSS